MIYPPYSLGGLSSDLKFSILQQMPLTRAIKLKLVAKIFHAAVDRVIESSFYSLCYSDFIDLKKIISVFKLKDSSEWIEFLKSQKNKHLNELFLLVTIVKNNSLWGIESHVNKAVLKHFPGYLEERSKLKVSPLTISLINAKNKEWADLLKIPLDIISSTKSLDSISLDDEAVNPRLQYFKIIYQHLNCSKCIESQVDKIKRLAEKGVVEAKIRLEMLELKAKDNRENTIPSFQKRRSFKNEDDFYAFIKDGIKDTFIDDEFSQDINLSSLSDLRHALEVGAVNGYEECQYLFGKFLLAENPKSLDAVNWFRKAAEENHVEAQYALGAILESDNKLSEAFSWYTLAARQNNIKAQYKLGYFYYNGLNGDHNVKEAFKWLLRSAKQLNLDALYMLGLYYEEGKGEKKNMLLARKWYRLALEKGNKDVLSKYVYAEVAVKYPKFLDRNVNNMIPELTYLSKIISLQKDYLQARMDIIILESEKMNMKLKVKIMLQEEACFALSRKLAMLEKERQINP